MAKQLRGADVAREIGEQLAPRIESLVRRGVTPTLSLVRVGAREEDVSYEESLARRFQALGVALRVEALPSDVGQEALCETVKRLAGDTAVHGIVLLRPLPERLDERAVIAAIPTAKDVDGLTAESQAGVYASVGEGFPPCTAQACVRLLRYYGVPLRGKRVAVVGRGLTSGRPAAMLLLGEDATVTLCHSATEQLARVVREADIVVSAMGKPGVLGPDCFAPGQTVLDVGLGTDGLGRLRGDVDPETADVVDALAPVPGGVGAVTGAVLAEHVVAAAERAEAAGAYRLRIGIFIDTYFPMIDGVVMCVDNYARYLSQYAEVTVFTTVVDRDFEDKTPYRVVRCHSLPVPGEDYVVPAPDMDREFWETLDKSELDIVHINSPFTVGMAGVRYARRHGVPVVATMHSQFRTDFKRALRAEPLVDEALAEIMKVFDSADEVWVPNSAMQGIYREYGGTKEPRVRSNATDMRPVADAAAAAARVDGKYGLSEGERVLLFVGRLVLHKNILFIAQAAAELARLTKEPFRVLFVGAGPDEQALLDEIQRLGIRDKVTLTGRVTDREELAELYSRSSLFLFPSLYDANSLVQIEAASQGTPTVFLRGAVTGATAEDGVSGFFADNDPARYAGKIAEILSDEALLERVSAGARRDVYCSWETVISRMLGDYRRLRAQARAKRVDKGGVGVIS